MPATSHENPPSIREQVDAARIIVEAVEGLHLLAEAAAMPFLAYLIGMVEAEATTVIASGSPKLDAPN